MIVLLGFVIVVGITFAVAWVVPYEWTAVGRASRGRSAAVPENDD